MRIRIYLPICLLKGLVQEMSGANLNTPVLICHGSSDDIVPLSAGRKAAQVLQSKSVPATFKVYQGSSARTTAVTATIDHNQRLQVWATALAQRRCTISASFLLSDWLDDEPQQWLTGVGWRCPMPF